MLEEREVSREIVYEKRHLALVGIGIALALTIFFVLLGNHFVNLASSRRHPLAGGQKIVTG